MTNQAQRKPGTQAETVVDGDLKGSDFFPPGTGWNEAPREIRDLDVEQREKAAAKNSDQN